MSNRKKRRYRVWEAQRERGIFSVEDLSDEELCMVTSYLSALDLGEAFIGDRFLLFETFRRMVSSCQRGRVLTFPIGDYILKVEGLEIEFSKSLGFITFL